MISNPVRFFAGGGSVEDSLEFTYEGGSKLFHFCPADNNLTSHMVCNVIFFANDENHARDVLIRMFEFAIDCIRKQAEYYISMTKYPETMREFVVIEEDKKYHEFKSYLDAIKDGRARPVPAPTNQFYKVGWAFNDTII